MWVLIINDLRLHFGKKLYRFILSYNFYPYDEGNKIKN